ncbi:glycosyltransferase family protein [Pedobacter jejuensis]|uniref:Glycosyltransferase n=1 Tax=Pedobacter jejuensis TaxID=1268550 RepID=A0A3N0BPZ8_9SPHI|nr:hypothetical protein [Pedobacter jejuensis]RNL51134.1 hypothetical protein D7004_15545 [Pedobacter jejuensis]
MKKICFITPSHISSNPRLVKEASLFDNLGYQVHIIFTQNLEFLISHDKKILAGNSNWTFNVLNNDSQKFSSKLSNLFRTIGSKLASVTSNLFPDLNNIVVNKNFYWQLKCAISCRADLYIAHNLGALPVAVIASQKNKSKCGFDAEDYHRQEISDDTESKHYRLVKFIEDKYLSKTNYFTTASPLMADNYISIYQNLKPVVINNVFASTFIQQVKNYKEPEALKLFWFSQTIGKNRGIEDAIHAISFIKKGNISLTLLGNIDSENFNYFTELAKRLGLLPTQLRFIPPIFADDIFQLANQYDIGLALEPGFCLNNNLALSNKIFTYLMAGLAIIASESTAQTMFIKEHPSVGKSYPVGDYKILADLINEFDENRTLLFQTKLHSYQLAKEKYNWEEESKKLIKIINGIF